MRWTHRSNAAPKKVNHASVLFDDFIYVFGGYCSGQDFEQHQPIEVNRFNTRTMQWANLTDIYKYREPADVPFNRYGHTVVSHEDKIYLWGGRDDESSCNTLYQFDVSTHTWRRPEVKGCIPYSRDGHSAAVKDDCMYIFGGWEADSEVYSQQIHLLNLKTFHWRLVTTTGESPSSRDFPTMTCLNDYLYVFGGRGDALGLNQSGHDFYDDNLFQFDIKRYHWSRVPTKSSPIGRRSHSAFVYNNKLYIFGGFNALIPKHFNDLHCFNPKDNTWTEISINGNGPCPRRRQCCVLSDHQLYIFGGTSPESEYIPITGAVDQVSNSHPHALLDHSDLYVLDFSPSLKTLAKLECIRLGLDTRQLPHSLKEEIEVASEKSETPVSRPSSMSG